MNLLLSKTRSDNDVDGVDNDDSNNARKVDTKAATPSEEFKNKNNLRDQIVSAISSNGEIKVTAATTRNLINEIIDMQSLTAVSTDALARSMTCSLLLSNGMQDEQTFQLTMACAFF